MAWNQNGRGLLENETSVRDMKSKYSVGTSFESHFKQINWKKDSVEITQENLNTNKEFKKNCFCKDQE